MEERAGVGARLVNAFWVGGLIGAIMQVVMLFFKQILPGEMATMASPLTLLVMGIAGMILSGTGIYGKITKVGGFGAMIMFSGLIDAIGGIFTGATLKAGGDKSAGYSAALKFGCGIIGIILAFSVILGLILALMPWPMALANLDIVAFDPGMTIFVFAFLMAGFISLIGQLMLEFTHIPLPGIILIMAFCGGVIAFFGIGTFLETATGAGFACTVIDAAVAAVIGTILWVIAGVPMQLVFLIVLMILVIIFGLIAGNALTDRALRNGAPGQGGPGGPGPR